ncbi:MAG: addiction module protein [Verrucomicrobiota bacterium]
MAHDMPPDIAAAQTVEVRRRIAEVESGEVTLIPGDEALAHVCRIVASGDASAPVPNWKCDELHRRKERYMQHPASGRTWEQVKQRARAAG